MRAPRRSVTRCRRRMRRSRTGMRGLRPSAPPVSRVPRTCCSSDAGCSSACWCPRPSRRCPMRWRICARRWIVGRTPDASAAQYRPPIQAGHEAQPPLDARPAAGRPACLTRAADLLQQRRGLFLSLLVREAGKTLPDAVAELREAVDFCRYYAARGEELFGAPLELPGPTGESNTLSLHGRGVFVCISPWNFPLAIFTGQITAALVAGNAVVAKPAPATPLIAHADRKSVV